MLICEDATSCYQRAIVLEVFIACVFHAFSAQRPKHCTATIRRTWSTSKSARDSSGWLWRPALLWCLFSHSFVMFSAWGFHALISVILLHYCNMAVFDDVLQNENNTYRLLGVNNPTIDKIKKKFQVCFLHVHIFVASVTDTHCSLSSALVCPCCSTCCHCART